MAEVHGYQWSFATTVLLTLIACLLVTRIRNKRPYPPNVTTKKASCDVTECLLTKSFAYFADISTSYTFSKSPCVPRCS